MPTDNKAHYTDHLIQVQYHCVEINIKKTRQQRAVLFVFGGGMILGSDQGDVGLSRKIAEITNSDVWFPYYPLCHEHDMLENVQMIYDCYVKMLQFYKPDHIVFLGFSSGGALMLDLITYINELNDSGSNIPMPGLLIPISPGSVPVTKAEIAAVNQLDEQDIMIPAEYMFTAREIMCHGREIPEKYLATAHGDFRHAPMTHFYYGSAETLYAFAPGYAESYRNAGAECMIHVGKGMHHCYAIQYFIPGCKPAFDEVMRLIQNYFNTELCKNAGLHTESFEQRGFCRQHCVIRKPDTPDKCYDQITESYHQSQGIYDDVLTQSKWWSKLYIRLFWSGVDDNEIAEKVLSYIPKDFSGSLLDVPVGTAVFTHTRYAAMPHAEISGLDYSEDMLAQAKQKLANQQNVQLVQGDVGHLQFPDRSFDIVLSMNGFHAFPDKRSAFRETCRVLKHGGKFIGCCYICGESGITDTLVSKILVRKGWFTPPFDTAAMLRRRLEKVYDLIEFHAEGPMVYFCAVKR